MHINDLKKLTPQERLDNFAKMNSKDLELLMSHCSVELQERALVEASKSVDEGAIVANERLIWRDK